MKKNYWRVLNVDTTTADIHIYGVIGAWERNAAEFVQELKAIGRKDLNVHINSPGGEVTEGLAMYNALKNHRGTVNVYVDAYAVSAASFVAMAGDKVTMAPQSELMMHDAMGEVRGNAEEVRRLLDVLERTSDQIADIYAGKTGGEPKFWRKAMKRESWYNAREAVAAGLADGIGRSNASENETNEWDFTVYNYAGRIAAPPPVERPLELPDVNFAEMFRDAMSGAVREVWG